MRAANAKIAVFIIVLYLSFHKSKEQPCECSVKIEEVEVNGNKLSILSTASKVSVCCHDNNNITLTIDMSSCLKRLTMTFNWMRNDCLKRCCPHLQKCVTPDINLHNDSSCATVDTSTASPASKTTPAFTTSPVSKTTPALHNNTVTIKKGSLVALILAVCLLVLALALLTIGWIWTCAVMNRRKGLKITTENNRYTDMDAFCGKRIHENRERNGTQLENENQESSSTVNTGETYEVIAPLPYETVTIHAKPVIPDEIELSDVQAQTKGSAITRKSEATPEEDTGEQDYSNSQQNEPECKNAHTLEPQCTQ